MPRTVVGLLAAIAATMSVLAGLIHGHLEPFVTASAGIVAGLTAYLSLPAKRNLSVVPWPIGHKPDAQSDGFCRVAA
jgi:hypothetical protein